jgi:mannose-6-phosphate isomerase-like protein (cupin superfamily)
LEEKYLKQISLDFETVEEDKKQISLNSLIRDEDENLTPIKKSINNESFEENPKEIKKFDIYNDEESEDSDFEITKKPTKAKKTKKIIFKKDSETLSNISDDEKISKILIEEKKEPEVKKKRKIILNKEEKEESEDDLFNYKNKKKIKKNGKKIKKIDKIETESDEESKEKDLIEKINEKNKKEKEKIEKEKKKKELKELEQKEMEMLEYEKNKKELKEKKKKELKEKKEKELKDKMEKEIKEKELKEKELKEKKEKELKEKKEKELKEKKEKELKEKKKIESKERNEMEFNKKELKEKKELNIKNIEEKKDEISFENDYDNDYNYEIGGNFESDEEDKIKENDNMKYNTNEESTDVEITEKKSKKRKSNEDEIEINQKEKKNYVKKKKLDSFQNDSNYENTPHKHIPLNDLTPPNHDISDSDKEGDIYRDIDSDKDVTYQLDPNEKTSLDDSIDVTIVKESELSHLNNDLINSNEKRVRVRTLKFWENEKIDYENNEVVGIKKLKTPQNTKSSKKLPTQESVENGKFKVLTKENGKIVEVEKVIYKSKNMLKEEKISLNDLNDETALPIDISIYPSFTNDSFKHGTMEIGKKSLKPEQNSHDHVQIFYVVSGSCSVTIHNSTFNAKTYSSFVVPPGNNYSLENKNEKVCKLCYFMSKN